MAAARTPAGQRHPPQRGILRDTLLSPISPLQSPRCSLRLAESMQGVRETLPQ